MDINMNTSTALWVRSQLLRF